MRINDALDGDLELQDALFRVLVPKDILNIDDVVDFHRPKRRNKEVSCVAYWGHNHDRSWLGQQYRLRELNVHGRASKFVGVKRMLRQENNCIRCQDLHARILRNDRDDINIPRAQVTCRYENTFGKFCDFARECGVLVQRKEEPPRFFHRQRRADLVNFQSGLRAWSNRVFGEATLESDNCVASRVLKAGHLVDDYARIRLHEIVPCKLDIVEAQVDWHRDLHEAARLQWDGKQGH